MQVYNSPRKADGRIQDHREELMSKFRKNFARRLMEVREAFGLTQLEVEKKAKESGADDPKAVAAAAMWKNIKRG
jgi:hypothetical protein